MKIFPLFIYLILITSVELKGQVTQVNPSIDTSTFGKWPALGKNASISNDGKYVFYTLLNCNFKKRNTIIKSLLSKWEREINEVKLISFSQNSKDVIYIDKDDTLCILQLGENHVNKFPNVRNFQLFNKGNKEYIAYQKSTSENVLIIKSLEKNTENIFTNVDSYLINESGTAIVLNVNSGEGSTLTRELYWINLYEDNKYDKNIIWKGIGTPNIIFDRTGTQIAFSVKELAPKIISEEENGTEIGNSFWHYKLGDKCANLLANYSSVSNKGWFLNELEHFSDDSKKIYFKLSENVKKQRPTKAMVDIWSYKDLKLQSIQLDEKSLNMSYLAAVNVKDHEIIRLQQENEEVTIIGRELEDIAFIKHVAGEPTEQKWIPAANAKYSLLFINTGRRDSIDLELPDNFPITLSPNKKTLILKDRQGRDYYSYEISNGKINNLTENLPISKEDNEFEWVGTRPRGISLATWTRDSKYLLIYDRFDIWRLDVNNLKKPTNLTNGYGRKNNIEFRLLLENSKSGISLNKTYILSSFERTSINNGFYSIKLGISQNPIKLNSGAYVIYFPSGYGINDLDFNKPIKSKNSNTHLLVKQSASESPNYYITHDFKDFIRISDVFPEKNYNWITSELINFTTLDGNTGRGILYKPLSFNPNKKYPIIFNYYENESYRLNFYIKPESFLDNINVPFLVSQGYIVFRPEIHYSIGLPGQSAFNSVVGAAKYLTNHYPWIDSLKMGLQGHSFGAYETNYIIAHTNIFTAACSANGPINLISAATSISLNGVSNLSFYELSQLRLGYSLWERPDIYIKNSPIFDVNKISTPVLLMYNKNDASSVPFAQGIEFFTSLRRLGKTAWMLQYDSEGHSLIKKENRLDYTLRVTQFFNYYLKDSRPPKWMTNSIPAKLKGVDDGLKTSDQKL